MRTRAFFFPFDLFGSGGTRDGALALADAFQEMLADNKRERVATRARAYARKVHFEEFCFDKLAAYENWRPDARKAIRRVWSGKDFLLWVTGNHLGALPIYDELAGTRNTLVIQFDAHLDIYNLTDCTAELSHGNYLLHCAGPLPNIVNVGHRDLLLRRDYVAKYFQTTFSASELLADPEPALKYLRVACAAAERLVIDFDCDVFDPAYFPALSHPVPFGLSPQLVLRFLDAVWSKKVIGLALSEFDPARDQRDQSLATLMWLIEYLLLRNHETV